MATLSEIMVKLKPVRGRMTRVNKIFDDTLQNIFSNAVWNLTQSGTQSGTFRSLADFLPYNAGYSYISDNLSSGNTEYNTNIAFLPPTASQNREGVPPYALLRSSSAALPSKFYDANVTCNNIAGYLTYEKLSDFLARKNLTVAAKMYVGQNNTIIANTGSNVPQYVDCDSNKNLIDSSDIYADYIIPYITWYVDDNTGKRMILDATQHRIAVNNVVVFTSYNTALFVGTAGSIPETYVTQITQLGGQGALFAPLPYIDQKDRDYTGDYAPYRTRNNVFCGSVITRRDPSTSALYFRQFVPAKTPYVTLALSQPSPIVRATLIDMGGGKYVCGGNFSVNNVTVYRSVDDFIDLFADAGVFVSTNLDDVYTHHDTPPIVNPDPTDTLDSFPDNTTDTTPINSGYITGASFGGQLIYTPLTAKTFLKWVGDSGVNINNWGRLFANPIDVILSAKLYNLDLVTHDNAHVRSNAQTNILGVVNPDLPNYSIDIGYNNIVDGGSIYLMAYYGNYADFASMTYQCYIPYVGFTTLRAGDVVNTTLHLRYAVDFSTGSAVALLTANDKLIYTSACNVASTIPIASSDRFSQELNNSIAAIKGAGNIILGAAQKNPVAVAGAVKDTIGGLQLQTHYTTRGNLNSINAYELIPPFIERTRFDLFYPNGDQNTYKKYVGTPSTQFDILAHCADSNGYVVADYIYLSDCPATDAEQAEIKRIIAGGVYL